MDNMPSADQRAALIQILTVKPLSSISLGLTVLGAAAGSYFLRSIGVTGLTSLVIGALCGGSVGLIFDVSILYSRIAKAREMLTRETHDG